MSILILGGTRFLGPALVASAQARGHEVTIFNRGRSNPNMFPDIEKLVGDRDPRVGDGLKTLQGRRWDAVIDTSGYVPRHVRASAELLAGSVDQYVFVSTISVYANPGERGIDESSPVATLADNSIETVDDANYGPLKAQCEKAAEDFLKGRVTVIRPGLIVGPRDPTYRFTYWLDRIARGGEVLAPGDGNDAVQLIDVRDVADYAIHCIEGGHTGIYNAVGPECRLTMAELLHGCRAVTGGCVSFTWTPVDFLREREISEWTDLPVWVDEQGEAGGFSDVMNSRAMEKGISFRPLAETAAATLQWFESLSDEGRARQRSGGFGLSQKAETEALEAWRVRANP